MKITHYLYNAFLIEWEDKIIAIDPGGLFFYYFRFTTLIPKSEWKNITHIFVTHGDPDHFWHLDHVAEASNAPVICHKSMLKAVNGEMLMLGPRSKGLAFTKKVQNVHILSVDETIELDGLSITGIKSTHGILTIKMGPFSKTVKTGPNERIGWGSMGFEIGFNGHKVVNLGDTLLHRKEWERVKNPDILMIPIGGKVANNTMDELEALEAVQIMRPGLVIPTHYNCPGLFSRKLNPADDKGFKKEVERLGIRCEILGKGESIKY